MDDAIWKTDGVQDIQLTDLTDLYYCDSHPDVSPNGSWVVFQRNNYYGGQNCASLWVVDVNGLKETEIVSCSEYPVETGGSQWPKFSPDSKKIAFWHGASGHDYRDVYSVDFPAGTLKRLSFLQGQPGNDMNWITEYTAAVSRIRPAVPAYKVLTSMNPGRNSDLYPDERNVAKIDFSGNVTWLTTVGDDVCSLQSSPMPDGRIVYMLDDNDRGDIWIMNKDGSNKKRLTNSADTGACYNHPTPHPGSKYIAFWSNEGVGTCTWSGCMRLWMMTADGKYRGVVMDDNSLDPGYWRQLKFNPNGTRLLFTCRTETYTDNLCTLNLDTLDSDGDQLKNWEEAVYGTDENNRDTDGGGELDGSEVAAGRNPNDPGDDRPVFIRR
jgi:Tol biopolymer transport system component